MRSFAIASLLLATLTLVPVVPAQVATTAEGTTLRVKYVAGQVRTYKVETEVAFSGPEGLPSPQKSEVTVRQEVVEVKDGVATVKVETTGGPAEVPTQTFRVDERGKIVDAPEGTSEKSALSGMPSGFPERALKPGETWSTEAVVPGIPDGAKVMVDSTFVGVKTIEGESLTQLDFKMSLVGEMTLDGEGSVFLDPTDGQLVSTTAKTRTTVSLPGSEEKLTVSVSMTMKRV